MRIQTLKTGQQLLAFWDTLFILLLTTKLKIDEQSPSLFCLISWLLSES